MRIATIVFVYNRSMHTEKVLEALSRNRLHPEKLFIFQDGLKEESHRIEWKKVNCLIHNITWCDCEIRVSDENQGLARSIVSGINIALENYDAVIVLEDDCVPHPMFMEYMVQSLNKYLIRDEVYSVGGYAWPVEVPDNGADAYFTGRISSWGWGTWKNRWEKYSQDYQMLAQIKKDADLDARFHVWGEDLESHLMGNVAGTCDSWAVFWALTVIKNKGYCLAPYQSLIENIGFDGSGVHCGKKRMEQNLRNWEDCGEVFLPETIEFPHGCEIGFSDYFSWTPPVKRQLCYNNVLIDWMQLMRDSVSIAGFLLRNSVSRISIWGKGNICNLLLHELGDKIEVLSIVETYPSTDVYRGIKIVTDTEIPKETQLIIVIPTYDLEKIQRRVNSSWKHMTVGLDWLIAAGRISEKSNIQVSICRADEIIRCGNQYGGFDVDAVTLKSKQILVYSFGIGEDVSFSQAILENFQATVYAFDPTPKAVEYVRRSALYRNDRFHFYAYALATKDGETDFYLPVNEEHVSGSLIQHSDLKKKGIRVVQKKLKTILRELGHKKIDVLKLDIEGAEFEVMDNILSEGIVFEQLCIEIHGRFFNNGEIMLIKLIRKLSDAGYVLRSLSKNLQEFTFMKSKDIQ